jgi:hypothetical protein
MEHIAIMRKSWGLTEKLLSGEKSMESRWYLSRHAPWNRISTGEPVYFKNSGEPVTIKATVAKVLQFEDLNQKKVKDILNRYWKVDGFEEEEVPEFFELFKDKRYCILLFLKDVKRVEPFNIDKSGFGMMSAWISLDDVNKIKTD